MTWLLIGFLFLAAFGPILWLLPSERDKRLSKLRMEARRRGLAVELTRLPDPRPRPHDRVSSGGVVKSPVVKCAAYRMHVPRPLELVQPWRVSPSDASAREKLADYYDSMPSDWLAVEVDRNGACLYWREEVSDATAGDKLDAVVGLLGDLIANARSGNEKDSEGAIEPESKE